MCISTLFIVCIDGVIENMNINAIGMLQFKLCNTRHKKLACCVMLQITSDSNEPSCSM
jgi:hypothetical protein